MARQMVLVVEDRRSQADAVCAALRAAGYDAMPAAYREAHRTAAHLQPALILLISVAQRPQVDLITAHLAADPATRAIPVVATPDELSRLGSRTPADIRSRRVVDALAEVVALVAGRIGPA